MTDLREKIIDFLYKKYPEEEFLLADGYELAFMGVKKRKKNLVTCYNRDICLALIAQEGLSYTEAVEYFDFNISSAYVGTKTPIFI